jgi:D-3-phosphoglycerate dehydrogenase
MSTYRVVVVSLGYGSYDTEREILKPIGAELILAPRDCVTEDEVIEAAKDADAVLVREAPMGERVINSLQRCKVIVRYGVGVDNIHLHRARDRKIYVANLPGYGTEEVSDHAVALLLACVRNLLVRDRNVRQGKPEFDIRDTMFRTTGKVLGLVGYGLIGKAFHRKWKGFLPHRVLVFDPTAPAEVVQENGGEKVDLDVLLANSDFISLHASLTPQSRHLIDESSFQKMKPTAILVNTARGELVDEKALVRALKENRILAAGLDVFEREPPLPPDHPLLSLTNVILTGHMGWYSKDSVKELQTRGAQEVFRVLSGEPPKRWVNPW